MRKIYQRDWFGIEFATFTQPSNRVLADTAFYEAFYQAFFQRYHSWEDLDPHWRDQKATLARFILTRTEVGEVILSLGCGLGWIEHCLLDLSGGALHLEATEVAPAALKWIKAELPPERLFLGVFPQCLPEGRRYDLIYLSALDYCLDQPSLTGLLTQVAGRLQPAGRCLVISASFDPTPSGWPRARQVIKQAAAALLEGLRLYQRGQFWGWTRTRKDYRQAFARAGFAAITDGFLDGADNYGDYWIMGQVS